MLQKCCSNRLLRDMPVAAFNALSPAMELVSTESRQSIFEPDTAIEFTYFPEIGHASILAVCHERDEIEIAIVGYEGLIGFALSPLLTQSPLRSAIHVPGTAWRISTTELALRARGCPELQEYLGRFSHYLTVLAAYTALSHGSYSVPERLARWILMAHDRSVDDDIHVSHQFLSLILGVRRPGVTTALHILEGEQAIRTRRRVIQVRDRSILRSFTNGCYGVPEREYERLFGTGITKDGRATNRPTQFVT